MLYPDQIPNSDSPPSSRLWYLAIPLLVLVLLV
jgi:hypothetical protein